MTPREWVWFIGWHLRRDEHECCDCRQTVNVRPWQRCPGCRVRWP